MSSSGSTIIDPDLYLISYLGCLFLCKLGNTFADPYIIKHDTDFTHPALCIKCKVKPVKSARVTYTQAQSCLLATKPSTQPDQ